MTTALKMCPYCKTDKPADAVKCRHCGSDVPFTHILQLPVSRIKNYRSVGAKVAVYVLGLLFAILFIFLAIGHCTAGNSDTIFDLIEACIGVAMLFWVIRKLSPTRWWQASCFVRCPSCNSDDPIVFDRQLSVAGKHIDVNCPHCGTFTRYEVTAG